MGGKPEHTALRTVQAGTQGARERVRSQATVRTAAPDPARSLELALSTQGGLPSEHVLALQGSIGNQAVQRLLAGSGSAARSGPPIALQRRMNWTNTKWAGAGYLSASSGGGGGVLFVGEREREVVVKPGEEMATETALASMLVNKVGQAKKRSLWESARGKGKGKEGMNIVAPGVRLVDKVESQQIKSAVSPLLDQVGTSDPAKEGKFKNDRARELVRKLDDPGVVVQDLAAGQGLNEAAEVHRDHTEETTEGDRVLKADSPLRIFQDKRSVTGLGRVTAVDLFTGNKDRLFQFNAENLMVTPFSVTAIDNIWMGTNMSYFQTTAVKDENNRDRTITQDEALAEWMADSDVRSLADGDYDAITDKVWAKILDNASFQRSFKMKEQFAAKRAFAAAMAASETMFRKAFSEGLRAGKKQLVESLDRLLKKPDKLRRLAPGVDLSEIMESVRRRKRFLQGKA